MFREGITNYISKLKSYPIHVRIIFLLVVIVLILYFTARVLFLGSLLTYAALFIFTIALAPKNLNLKVKLTHLILIILALIPIAIQYFGFFVYNIQLNENFFYPAIWIDYNSRVLKALILFILVFFAYFQSTFTYGWVLNKLLKVPDTNFVADMFRNICTGTILLTTILFALGCFKLINFSSLFIIYIPTIFNKNFYDLLVEFLLKIKAINLNITKKNALITLLSIFGFIFYLISILRNIPVGTDAYRVYLLLPKYISENAGLPTTQTIVLWPFTTEIFISPAFIIGGIPVATAVLYTFSLLFLLGFYLFFKELGTSNRVITIILLVGLTFPPFLRMIDGEFKIDIFLALISSFLYLCIELFRKGTRNFNYIYLIAITAPFLILTKPISIIYVLPLLILVLIAIIKDGYLSFFFKNSWKIIMVAILIPAIWFIFYKFELPEIGRVGLGLSPVAKYEPLTNITFYTEREVIIQEESLYTGKRFTGVLFSYLKLPAIYITLKQPALFSLLDIGLPIVTIYALVLLSSTITKYRITNDYLFTSLISLGFFLVLSPILVWYGFIPIFIATSFLIIEVHNKRIELLPIIEVPTKIYFGVCLVGYLLFTSTSNYTQPYIAEKNLIDNMIKDTNGSPFQELYNQVAEVLNQHKEDKIVLTHHHNLMNIPYFFDNYFDRVIFLDSYFVNGTPPQNLRELMVTNNFHYLLVNNKDDIKDTFPQIHKELVEVRKLAQEQGKKIHEGEFFTLYYFD